MDGDVEQMKLSMRDYNSCDEFTYRMSLGKGLMFLCLSM